MEDSEPRISKWFLPKHEKLTLLSLLCSNWGNWIYISPYSTWNRKCFFWGTEPLPRSWWFVGQRSTRFGDYKVTMTFRRAVVKETWRGELRASHSSSVSDCRGSFFRSLLQAGRTHRRHGGPERLNDFSETQWAGWGKAWGSHLDCSYSQLLGLLQGDHRARRWGYKREEPVPRTHTVCTDEYWQPRTLNFTFEA